MMAAMPPRIVIHSLAHARAALAAAAECGKAVTLASASGAAAYLGAAVFREMVAEAARAFPGVAVTAVLDCGEDAGLALNALRHGLKAIRLQAGPEATAAVADIAAQLGAELEFGEAPPALDLLGRTDPATACRAWLLGAAPAARGPCAARPGSL